MMMAALRWLFQSFSSRSSIYNYIHKFRCIMNYFRQKQHAILLVLLAVTFGLTGVLAVFRPRSSDFPAYHRVASVPQNPGRHETRAS